MSPQSYYLGGKLRSIDFNNFIQNINEIVGIGAGDSGYGQDRLVMKLLTPGEKIRATHWDSLLAAMSAASIHQGIEISVPTSTADPAFPSPRNIAQIVPQLQIDIDSIRLNKLNYDLIDMSIETNKISSSASFSSTTGAEVWNNNIKYVFSANFNNDDHRRHFFNSGGEIRVSSDFSPSPSSSVQSLEWDALLSNIGVIKFSHSACVSSQNKGTPGGGFNSLTSTYVNVYQRGGSDYYASFQYTIRARLNNISGIDFETSFIDVSLPLNSVNPEITGSLTVSVDQQRSTGEVNVPSPIYQSIIQL